MKGKRSERNNRHENNHFFLAFPVASVSKEEIIILFSEKFRHNMLEIIEKGIFGIHVIDVLNSVKFYNL